MMSCLPALYLHIIRSTYTYIYKRRVYYTLRTRSLVSSFASNASAPSEPRLVLAKKRQLKPDCQCSKLKVELDLLPACWMNRICLSRRKEDDLQSLVYNKILRLSDPHPSYLEQYRSENHSGDVAVFVSCDSEEGREIESVLV
jgi:hypothetical protein